MAVVGNKYGAIITKGLGFPACCAIITAPFGLVCGCIVEPVPPPDNAGGGGGGLYPVLPPLYHTPRGQRVPTIDTRLVTITIKMKDKEVWRRKYVVNKYKGDIVVNVINIINRIKEKTSVGVNNIRQVVRRVSVWFKKEDK